MDDGKPADVGRGFVVCETQKCHRGFFEGCGDWTGQGPQG
jgi:hypothetical protein